MKFELTILGSSSATPVFNRFPSAQLLNINEKLYLIDCGEGTQMQLMKYGLRTHRIDHIFISHLHGDHYLGLPGLLSSMHLQGRRKPLQLFGPQNLLKLIELNLECSQTELRYPLHFHAINPKSPESIFENKEITVNTIILNHRVACTGFLFKEKERPLKMDKAKLMEYNIPADKIPEIKKGMDLQLANGKVIANKELTLLPPKPRAFAYCSDTLVKPDIVPQLQNIDLLYHEATFLSDMEDRASETFHTTAAQAARIAQLAQVKRLIIGHFSARYKQLEPLLEEAVQVFPNTELAVEGTVFEVLTER